MRHWLGGRRRRRKRGRKKKRRREKKRSKKRRRNKKRRRKRKRAGTSNSYSPTYKGLGLTMIRFLCGSRTCCVLSGFSGLPGRSPHSQYAHSSCLGFHFFLTFFSRSFCCATCWLQRSYLEEPWMLGKGRVEGGATSDLRPKPFWHPKSWSGQSQEAWQFYPWGLFSGISCDRWAEPKQFCHKYCCQVRWDGENNFWF